MHRMRTKLHLKSVNRMVQFNLDYSDLPLTCRQTYTGIIKTTRRPPRETWLSRRVASRGADAAHAPPWELFYKPSTSHPCKTRTRVNQVFAMQSNAKQ